MLQSRINRIVNMATAIIIAVVVIIIPVSNGGGV